MSTSLLRGNPGLERSSGHGRKHQTATPQPGSIKDTEFHVSGGKWKSIRTDFIGQVIYTNGEDGVTLSAIDGKVASVTYDPPQNKFENLRCPKCSVDLPPPDKSDISSDWVTGYDQNVTSEQEKERLDRFVSKLKKLALSKAYIIAYDGCLSPKGTTRERAIRAKEYLVAAGIESKRVIMIEAGQRQMMSIELHVRAHDVPPPKTFS